MAESRRQRILAAIVEQYVATGEPVGSKALLDKLDVSVSSATIRNDMAALTKLGYIYQPHTSAGRIPTQSGYRYYVDHLMQVRELGETERRRIEAGVDARSGDPEELLKTAEEALVSFTNFASISTTPSDENATIRNIEMVQVSSRIAMVVLLTSTGILKSKACRTDVEITPAFVDTFHQIVDRYFRGKPLTEISLPFIQTLVASLGAAALSLSAPLIVIADLVSEACQTQVRLGGQNKLLGYKDYEGNSTELMNFLHQEEPLNLLLEDSKPSGPAGIEIRIGSENHFKELANSTTIISRYRIGGGATGAIGIIGPTRMDYPKIISGLKYLSDIVSSVLSEVYEEDNSTNDEQDG
ncbi:MAG TPA: heat-inducible transcriptional repressor HrcA, partial [Clostridiales bacterium]|nr:heat-inducible transcriptional repressor HrcA [Clostridiales bacterium]